MDGRLIFVHYNNKTLCCLIQDNKLIEVMASEESQLSVGDIVLGKVKNVVKNIGSAFVDLGQGQLGYLALSDIAGSNTAAAGDELVVQIAKEAVKTKEAVLTTNLSFAGKYAVVTKNKKKHGFSEKLSPKTKKIIQEVLQQMNLQYGVIIRTNAENLTDYQILMEEIMELSEECAELEQMAEYRTCYSVLKKQLPAYLTQLRDTYSNAYQKIMTDDKLIYEQVLRYLQTSQPEDADKLEFYEDSQLTLSNLYGISSKVHEALEKKVWLKSGGYLVIEPTEALTVIDVNTGKYSGKKKVQETYFILNKEACEVIAVQMRLRNLSGIIIVDFINMKTQEEQQEILRHLTQLLKRDPVKCSVVDMTPLGLVEITRKKINKSLREQLQ